MDRIEDQGHGARELFQAQAHLYKHVFSYMSSMLLKCAVELGIPDIISRHGPPITLPELVSALGIQPTKTNGLLRLMRFLAHAGFFSATKVQNAQEEEGYALTSSSMLLLKDKSYCLSPFVFALVHPAFVTPCHFLSNWFRGDELAAFETTHGMNFWDFVEQNPEFNNVFNQGMASDSRMANLIVKDCKPIFERLGSLVDVGGGTGSFTRIISEAFPDIKCTVLDLPHVVANLPETENLKYIAGDMFQAIPPADAYFFKLIFHAFGDEDCLKILKKCREALSSKADGGKVIIVDIVINEKKDEPEITETKLAYDSLMMVAVSGREKTEKDWERIFLEAGFTRYKITPLFGLRSLIEVFP